MPIDYSLLPKRKKQKEKGGGTRKYGRNRKKCERYRARVGKPNGPGQPGRKTKLARKYR